MRENLIRCILVFLVFMVTIALFIRWAIRRTTKSSSNQSSEICIATPAYHASPTDRTYHHLLHEDMIDVYLPPNPRTDMCICEVCIGEEYAKKMKRMSENRLEYAKKHNVAYFVLRKSPYPSMHAAYQKIPLVKYLCDRYSYEWIVTLDTDLIITNQDWALDTFFDPSYDFIFSTWESKHGTVLQSSAFVIRNCALARDYLDDVWKSCLYRKTFFVADPHIEDWGEQTHMDVVAHESKYVHRSKFVAENEFQCSSGKHCKNVCVEGKRPLLSHPVKDESTMDWVMSGACQS